ncbi:MAG: 3-phosphoglycerate dehydrogenase [Ruminococcaceae bacterium]|nr:3-phosphoglycerate dehydrogenase [Oscillospiraceae bacterium]
MKNIQLLNKIAPCGTDLFDKEKYAVAENIENPDAIMVRSAVMHEMEFGSNLKAIARAGAGVNNIPLDRCAEEGIVVFNTPGANANAVKELAIAALMLASRDIVGGIEWAKTLEGTENVAKQVEKGKSKFGGVEITGKTLGIIGLGAIGGMLANAAEGLGMKVIGCDPYLSVDAAWNISSTVERVATFEDVFKMSDYISVHVPATNETKGFLNEKAFGMMKNGVRIINLARADLVNVADLKTALESGKVASYVTDFPTEETICVKGIVAIPHLGASTEQAEDNCAVMAAKELIDYLENGNIKNSVNYPNAATPRAKANRVCVLHENIEGLASKITSLYNGDFMTKTRGKYAYTIIDTDVVSDDALSATKAFEGVYKVNII